MDKNKKVELVENLSEKFKNSSALYFTKYTGMNVPQATELREKFKDNDVDYLVSKNTLTKLAIAKSGLNNNIFDNLDYQPNLQIKNLKNLLLNIETN